MRTSRLLWRQARHGSYGDGPFAPEVAEKCPRGCSFPRGGRPRLTLAMGLGKEDAKGGAVGREGRDQRV